MSRVKQALYDEDEHLASPFDRLQADEYYRVPTDRVPDSLGIDIGMSLLHDEEDRGTSPRLSDE